MTKSVQEILNAAYGGIGRRTSFTVLFTDIVGVRHRFYFHEAIITCYKTSIWVNPHVANPVEVCFTSASGLTMRLTDYDRKGVYSLNVENPKRLMPLKNGGRTAYYPCMNEESVVFFKTLNS